MTSINNMDVTKDYYKILGVKESATPKEIKKAYHTLSKENNKNGQEAPKVQERQKELNEAHTVLKKADTRATYDSNRIIDNRSAFKKTTDKWLSPNHWKTLRHKATRKLQDFLSIAQRFNLVFKVNPSHLIVINRTFKEIEESGTTFSNDQKSEITVKISRIENISKEDLLAMIKLLPDYHRAKQDQSKALGSLEPISLTAPFKKISAPEELQDLTDAIKDTSKILRGLSGSIEGHRKKFPNSAISLEADKNELLLMMNGKNLRSKVGAISDSINSTMEIQNKQEQERLDGKKGKIKEEKKPSKQPDPTEVQPDSNNPVLSWFQNIPKIGKFFGGK